MVLDDLAVLGCVWRDALNVLVDEEGHTTVGLEHHPVDWVVIRAAFATDAPNQLREAAPVHTVARHRQADEALAVPVMTPWLAIIDWEEADEHIRVQRMAIDAGKVDVARTVSIVAVDLDHLKVLVRVGSPRLRPLLPRPRDHDEPTAVVLQIGTRVDQPPAILVDCRELTVEHHHIVRATTRIVAPAMPPVEGKLVW